MRQFHGRWAVFNIDGLRHDPKDFLVADALVQQVRSHAVSEENLQLFRAGLDTTESYFSNFGFTVSMVKLAKMRRHLEPGLTTGKYFDLSEELRLCLMDELEVIYLLAIDPSVKQYYVGSQLFGPTVADRFKSTSDDIEEAGKCLALDRGTACVFHLMQVLEVGLQVLAADLGIAVSQNWQKLLNDVRGAVNKLPFGTDEEKKRTADRSAASAHLQNVKDAWRNDVTHPRGSYTPEQARDVFLHTRALMVKLAGFL